MPKRRRGAVDDSDESDAVASDSSSPLVDSEPDDEPQPGRRRRRLRGHDSGDENADVKTEDGDTAPDNGPDMAWPVTLKTGPQNGGRTAQKKGNDDDDEYTDSSSAGDAPTDSSDYEDEKLEYSDGGFVVDSDENELPSYSRRTRSSRARQRRRAAQRTRAPRQRSARRAKSDDEKESEEDSFSDGSIIEELRELRSQESPRRRARNFRSRAPVDYAIPPPPTVEEVAQAAAIGAAQRMDSAARARDARLRRLFDVRGPFGGKDVVTIFGPSRAALERLASGQTSIPHLQPRTSALAADVDPLADGGDIDFSVVGGLDTYISKLKEMVSLPLLYPELYEKFGITPPRGVLFHGPPGTGKTLMARALAASHEQKVTFYMRKGADVLSKWIGESERQLRALFDEARANQPAIIFFDEIDGLAPVRSAKQEQHHASIVSTLLALMDGMDKRGQVVVIGATNRPDSVDPALRRPGRFDREFYFPLPDLEARQRILEIHTRKWSPLPEPDFLSEMAKKTKGFGGADLQALTTEAALLAIQRVFPQIYGSEHKLAVDTSQLHVRKQDFALALERAQPSTARSGVGGLAEPLPQRIAPLLKDVINKIRNLIGAQFEVASGPKDAQAALFLDEAAFSQARTVKQFSQQRIHRPRILLRGSPGMGQGYLDKAIASMLEGVYVRELGLGAMFGSDAPTPETAIVSAVTEARQRAPACLLLPHLEEWEGSAHLVALLEGLLRGILPSEAVLVVGVASSANDDLPFKDYFGSQIIDITLDTSPALLREFFAPLLEYIRRTPLECREAHELPRTDPPPLPLAAPNNTDSTTAPAAPATGDKLSKEPAANEETKRSAVFSEEERHDLRVRSQLKLKLGVLLDGFRTKYRRFRKPAVDEQNLVYLFTDEAQQGVGEDEQQQYTRTDDDMILDQSSGHKFFNMDLETVEDRLWNGYYSEPQQFLEDIEMIYRDSVELGDRERMHKASEMLANAQVAIDDIVADTPFAEACHKLRVLDAKARLKELDAAVAEKSAHDEQKLLEANGDGMDVDQQATEHADGEQQSNGDGNGEGNGTSAITQTGDAELSSRSSFSSNKMQINSIISGPATSTASANAVFDSEPAGVTSPPQFHEQGPVPTSLNAVASFEPIKDASREVVIAGGPSPEPAPEPFVLNEELLSQFLDRLLKSTVKFTLEQLEQLSAGLADVAWHHRHEWDRTLMLEALELHLSEMLDTATKN